MEIVNLLISQAKKASPAGAMLSSQITLINSAPLGPRYATTTGIAHSIDTTNFQIVRSHVVPFHPGRRKKIPGCVSWSAPQVVI